MEENPVELSVNSDIVSKVNHSMNVIEQCLAKYSPDKIAVGFNGGKDCTVVLHQYSFALNKKYSNLDKKPTIRALYINNKPQFDVVLKFIDECVKFYELDLIQINKWIKDGLIELKSTHPEIECVIMGTRMTDPHSSHLHEFSPTDPGWPEYMRCNPILNYSYQDVWKYLRERKVPYCPLYDQGFTSIGDKNTAANSNLKYHNVNTGLVEYKPAYLLENENSERHGREDENSNGK